MSASSTLLEQLLSCGIKSERYLLRRVFLFQSGGYEISGWVTAVANTDDGLPRIEVSCKHFAGFEIKDIILKDANGDAELITTSSDPNYRHYTGTIVFL